MISILKDSTAELSEHIRQRIKTILQQQGWVTREMFDVQQALLTKTRLKLEMLEKKLNDLENKEVKQ